MGIEPTSSAWKAEVIATIPYPLNRALYGGGGWIRTTEACASDLQSDPFGHSGTPPSRPLRKWCRHQESNSGPTDYKSVALPAELYRLNEVAHMLMIRFYRCKPFTHFFCYFYVWFAIQEDFIDFIDHFTIKFSTFADKRRDFNVLIQLRVNHRL